MMNVVDCDPGDVAIGKPVRIVWEREKVPQATLAR